MTTGTGLSERLRWQPIETAPKDATSILIYCPKARRPVCEAWWARDYEGGPGYWSTPISPAGRGYTILPEAATHWMPLPSPPLSDRPEAADLIDDLVARLLDMVELVEGISLAITKVDYREVRAARAALAKAKP